MKKNLIISLSFLSVLFVSSIPVLGDIYIDYNYKMAADGTLTTPYDDVFVETFNDAPTIFDQPGWTWSGYGAIRLGSDSGNPMAYAAPYNSYNMNNPDETYYFSVPVSISGEPDDEPVLASVSISELETEDNWAMVNFNLPEGQTYNYLGLFWGSTDTYNTFEFMKDGSLVAAFDGSIVAVGGKANGNQSAPYSNIYVNFYNLPEFDAVRFISTDYAFEFDNLAVGVIAVPVPGAVLLALLGLGMAGIKLRKFA